MHHTFQRQQQHRQQQQHSQLVAAEDQHVLTVSVLELVQPPQVAPNSIRSALEPGALVLQAGGLGGRQSLDKALAVACVEWGSEGGATRVSVLWCAETRRACPKAQ